MSFNWCFIGCGKLAHTVAEQMKKHGGHKIVSCYTRDLEKCKAFADKYGSVAYDNASDAITAEGVDGVYVVTPHNAHHRFTKLALELGKPVLCEKAFTVTSMETEELISLAKEKNLYLCEAMWTWFSPAANKVKYWVDSGEIGQARGADFTYHMMSVNYAPRNSDPRRAGGALLNITVYPIAYAYRLFGYPTKIESEGKLVGGIDHGEEIKMTFAGGEVVNISASMVDTDGFEKMTIYGERGKIKAPLYHASGIASLRRGLFNSKLYLSGGKLFNSYMDEFDKVAEEIRRGLTESEIYPLKSTLDVMKIMDEIRGQIGLEYNDLE